jgi:DNA polymerase I
VLRETFAARLARGLTPEDFAAVFADPRQPSLFEASLATARPILTVIDPSELHGTV